jgi:hypothetical protein
MSALIISVEYCTYNVALITVWEHALYYSGLNKKNISKFYVNTYHYTFVWSDFNLFVFTTKLSPRDLLFLIFWR